MESYFALRSLRVAQIPTLRGTYTYYQEYSRAGGGEESIEQGISTVRGTDSLESNVTSARSTNVVSILLWLV